MFGANWADTWVGRIGRTRGSGELGGHVGRANWADTWVGRIGRTRGSGELGGHAGPPLLCSDGVIAMDVHGAAFCYAQMHDCIALMNQWVVV